MRHITRGIIELDSPLSQSFSVRMRINLVYIRTSFSLKNIATAKIWYSSNLYMIIGINEDFIIFLEFQLSTILLLYFWIMIKLYLSFFLILVFEIICKKRLLIEHRISLLYTFSYIIAIYLLFLQTHAVGDSKCSLNSWNAKIKYKTIFRRLKLQ